MKNRFFKYFKIVAIDVIVYRMTKENVLPFSDLCFDIHSETLPNGNEKYFIKDKGALVHSSTLFNKLYLLKLIQKKGPAIGECYTNPQYRGKSIYPFVINNIAKELLEESRIKEVFILVNSDNISSIRGIEKAGFIKFYSIKAKRWLCFYFNKSIVRES